MISYDMYVDGELMSEAQCARQHPLLQAGGAWTGNIGGHELAAMRFGP